MAMSQQEMEAMVKLVNSCRNMVKRINELETEIKRINKKVAEVEQTLSILNIFEEK